MNIVQYDRETSLANFIDQTTKNRLKGIIAFESQCTPENKTLIAACEILIEHLNGVWDWKDKPKPARKCVVRK
jgi:hypothetical protein